jgi:hypothetical protein
MFFATIMLVALGLMGRAAIDTNARLHASQVLQATSALDAARDSVDIEAVTPGSPVEDLTIRLRNDGKRDITSWSSIDVIAVYTTAAGPVAEALTYTEDAVIAGTWSRLGGDTYDPGIFNVDEEMDVRAYLRSAPVSGSDARILVTLDGGGTFTHVFTWD